MSAKRLRWTGLSCLALSIVIAGLGFVAQMLFIVFGIILFSILQVPLNAVGNPPAGANTLPIPRVFGPSLLVAGLLFSLGVVCLLKSSNWFTRRGPI